MLKFLVPIIICTYFLPKFSEIFKDNFYVNSHAESKISKLAWEERTYWQKWIPLGLDENGQDRIDGALFL